MSKPSRSTRVETRENPSYLKEAQYIQECAARRETHVVRLGPILFFSTAGGDAWMLDGNDGEVACLARAGKPEPIPIVETESKFGIEWQGFFTLEGGVFTVESEEGGTRTYDGYPVAEIERFLNDAPAAMSGISAELDLARTRLALIGRNESCPCGSGKKYKKCCQPQDEARVRQAQLTGDRGPPVAERHRLAPASPTLVERADRDEDSDEGLDEGEALAAPWAETEPADDGWDNESCPEEEISPEVRHKRDEIWRDFDALKQPTTEQMNVHLGRLLALPPEATEWNDLFNGFAARGHTDLPGVFRRIVASVPPSPQVPLRYFYWRTIEEFVKRGQLDLVREAVAHYCTLDLRTYSADVLQNIEWWTMAAGLEDEVLALVERFLPILRTEDGLLPHVVPDEGRLLFELRVGACLRKPVAPGTDPAKFARQLTRDIEEEVSENFARQVAGLLCGERPPLEVARHHFDLPPEEVPENTPAWEAGMRRIQAMMQVAEEAWRLHQRPPGIVYRGLHQLVGEYYGDLDDRSRPRELAAFNLLDCLKPKGMEQRIVRGARGLMGTNPPLAHLLLEAHADLLRFAVRHNLIDPPLAAKSETTLASLAAKLGFPG